MYSSKKICEDCEEPTSGFDIGRVYGEQLNFREILVTGDIKDDLIEKAVIPIINYNRHDDACESKIKDYVREPIKILINSSGGVIDSCMALVSAIKSSKTPVHTVVLGKAYSAGFLILIAGHERYAQRYSRVMLHPGSGGYVGTFPGILKHANEIYDLQETINEYIVSNTFIPKEEVDEITEHEINRYMCANEALCYGVVDAVIMDDHIMGLEEYMESVEESKKKIKEEKKENKKVKKAAKLAKEK